MLVRLFALIRDESGVERVNVRGAEMQMGNYLACVTEKMHSQPLIYINYNQLKRAVGVRQRACCAPSSIRQNVYGAGRGGEVSLAHLDHVAVVSQRQRIWHTILARCHVGKDSEPGGHGEEGQALSEANQAAWPCGQT